MKYLYLLFFGLFLLLNGGASAQHFSFTPPENFVQDSDKLPTSLGANKNAGSVIQIAVSENTSYTAYSVAIHDSVFVAQNLVVKEKKEPVTKGVIKSLIVNSQLCVSFAGRIDYAINAVKGIWTKIRPFWD